MFLLSDSGWLISTHLCEDWVVIRSDDNQDGYGLVWLIRLHLRGMRCNKSWRQLWWLWWPYHTVQYYWNHTVPNYTIPDPTHGQYLAMMMVTNSSTTRLYHTIEHNCDHLTLHNTRVNILYLCSPYYSISFHGEQCWKALTPPQSHICHH